MCIAGLVIFVFETTLLLPLDRYKTAEQVSTFFQPLLVHVKAIPGVVEAAESSSTPPNEGMDSKVEVSGSSRPTMAGTGAKRQ